MEWRHDRRVRLCRKAFPRSSVPVQAVTRRDPSAPAFSADCRLCPRLSAHLADIRESHPGYHARPVPPFGDPRPGLLVVGLAPGMHGANRTGRPFTGDHAGILLYETLHRFGFGSQAEALSPDDGLVLKSCRITNAVKCLPPANKPLPAEIRTCNAYLRAELHDLAPPAVLALGTVAHQAVLRALDCRIAEFPFAHGAIHDPRPGLRLFDSYHCSRYNTQTRRLTPEMFRDIFAGIRRYLDGRG
ncbi:MAG: uracil-DNA glycosylase [Burkholderiales bacterium]|nr:uracil-DNA glycosylase [Burkholderiales bacterium]